jgi:hypothetical protein
MSDPDLYVNWHCLIDGRKGHGAASLKDHLREPGHTNSKTRFDEKIQVTYIEVATPPKVATHVHVITVISDEPFAASVPSDWLACHQHNPSMNMTVEFLQLCMAQHPEWFEVRRPTKPEDGGQKTLPIGRKG